MTAIVVECQFDQVQDILLGITGARTVPRVFVDGKCIGGGIGPVNWQLEWRKWTNMGHLYESTKPLIHWLVYIDDIDGNLIIDIHRYRLINLSTINDMGLSENVVYPFLPNGFADHYPYFLWLFHWEYSLFSDKPLYESRQSIPDS